MHYRSGRESAGSVTRLGTLVACEVLASTAGEEGLQLARHMSAGDAPRIPTCPSGATSATAGRERHRRILLLIRIRVWTQIRFTAN